jgi:hypothetical protein
MRRKHRPGHNDSVIPAQAGIQGFPKESPGARRAPRHLQRASTSSFVFTSTPLQK